MNDADQDNAANRVLDELLRTLPTRDLEPMAARALLVASSARLRGTKRALTWQERGQSWLLLGLSGLHLLWALVRVLTLAP